MGEPQLIHGTDADTARFSRAAFEPAREPKGAVLDPGRSHVDLYDKEEHVGQAIAKLTDFSAHTRSRYARARRGAALDTLSPDARDRQVPQRAASPSRRN